MFFGDAMEVDLVTSSVQEGGAFGVTDTYSNDNPNFEGETCGICMDAVIDRGVLDCCQHWFCFACIDNWATITNLCPLCQNEFQLITCVPVSDANTRFFVFLILVIVVVLDDDWSIEGKNNTLSFPSYYIDEN
ncbi:E3 ubiquitin-protein ligase DTX3L-like, partial [Prunus avium]|uniref:E3 ubiquitin-protein ligase DTX3L-like n=1 Tax=Prunus avium TaxID=42229 RepID=A0A6P5R8J1_PRUAV